jgi:hypothetical protein
VVVAAAAAAAAAVVVVTNLLIIESQATAHARWLFRFLDHSQFAAFAIGTKAGHSTAAARVVKFCQ